MIVQCQECSTKFKLDDAKVGDAGVKVRCAKCRHIFMVHREPSAEEPDVDSMLQGLGGQTPAADESASSPPAGPSIELDDDLLRTLAGAAGDEPATGTPEFSFDVPAASASTAADSGGGQEFELDISMPDSAATAPSPFEPPSFQEFSFDMPEETDEPDLSPPAADGAAGRGAFFADEGETFSFGETPLAVDGTAVAFPAVETGDVAASALAAEPEPSSSFTFEPFPGMSEEPVAGDYGFGAQLQSPVAPGSADEDVVFGEAPSKPAGDEGFTFTPAAPAAAEPASVFADAGAFTFAPSPETAEGAEPRGNDAELRTLLSRGGGDSSGSATDGPLVFGIPSLAAEEEEDYPPLSISSRKMGGASSGIRRLLLLLPVVLLAAGGGVGWWYVQQHGVAPLEGVLSAVGVDMAPRFELSGVKGAYAKGVDGAELFVVQGEVKNLSRFARAEVQVRAVLYGAGNRPLARKTAFCGNPLPLARLATLPLADIDKAMANRFGEGLSNLEVKGGTSVPFTVVFVAPPTDALDYGVELAGSVLAQKKKD